MPETHLVTNLLKAMKDGDEDAGGKLFESVHDELHKMAARFMARERRQDHTLQPTALVNEAFVRLIDGNELQQPDSRRWFFSAASRAMAQLLVEHERKRVTPTRGGDKVRVSADVLDGTPREYRPIPAGLDPDDDHPWDEVLQRLQGQYGVGFGELYEAIDTLFKEDQRATEIVWLRFIASMTMKEIANTLGITEQEVDRKWRLAQGHLKRYLNRGHE